MWAFIGVDVLRKFIWPSKEEKFGYKGIVFSLCLITLNRQVRLRQLDCPWRSSNWSINLHWLRGYNFFRVYTRQCALLLSLPPPLSCTCFRRRSYQGLFSIVCSSETEYTIWGDLEVLIFTSAETNCDHILHKSSKFRFLFVYLAIHQLQLHGRNKNSLRRSFPKVSRHRCLYLNNLFIY